MARVATADITEAMATVATSAALIREQKRGRTAGDWRATSRRHAVEVR